MFDYRYPNTSAPSRGWPEGYPNCHEELWVPLVAKNGVGFGRVHRAIHDLLELILNECIDRGYPPKAGECWGSVCRCSHRSDGTCAEDSQGRPIPSNHSYGLAIDLNSLDNPYGASTYKMPAWVPVLFKEFGFRWLGPAINDWQHFDFAGTPQDAKEMTEKARRELGEKDDDMSAAEIRKGSQAFRDKEEIPSDASADFRFGFNLEGRVKAARELPEPSDSLHCADDCSCRTPKVATVKSTVTVA